MFQQEILRFTHLLQPGPLVVGDILSWTVPSNGSGPRVRVTSAAGVEVGHSPHATAPTHACVDVWIPVGTPLRVQDCDALTGACKEAFLASGGSGVSTYAPSPSDPAAFERVSVRPACA